MLRAKRSMRVTVSTSSMEEVKDGTHLLEASNACCAFPERIRS